MYLTTSYLCGLVAAGVFPAIVSAQKNTSVTQGASPIFFVVPPQSPDETETIAAINQGLSLYNIALDTKNSTALDSVFATDILALVSPTAPLNSSAAYEDFLKSDLAPYNTYHTTTSVFVYNIGATSAQSASYSQAVYFGAGRTLAQTATYYERFNDVWTKRDGSWKIAKRSLNIFVRPFDLKLQILFLYSSTIFAFALSMLADSYLPPNPRVCCHPPAALSEGALRSVGRSIKIFIRVLYFDDL